jgi:hypothetical protein
MRRCSTRMIEDMSLHNASTRPCIVDAVLVEDDDSDDDSYDACNHERRKATLQLLESPFDQMEASFRSTRELHALELSLVRTFLGAQSVRQHCEM